MDIISINQRIRKIWDNSFPNDDNIRAPLLYESLIEEAFVYVGCNPSFSANKIEKILRHNPQLEIEDVNDFYKWNNVRNDFRTYEQKCKSIEALIRDKSATYFGVFDRVTSDLKIPSQGLDVFLYRERYQANLKPKLFNDKIGDLRDLTPFAKQQIDLFISVLKSINPRIILIANAFISDLLKNQLSGEISKDVKEDFHRFYGTPIFFSAMLSNGQLDKHSKERLVWQMQRALAEK